MNSVHDVRKLGKHKTRNKFTKEEDQRLTQLVEKIGSNSKWAEIASHMVNRTARQCRDRWNFYLSPERNTTEWSSSEEAQLLELYNKFGTSWSKIAQFFPGRTNAAVRNRVIALQRIDAKKEVDSHFHRDDPRIEMSGYSSDSSPNEIKQTPIGEFPTRLISTNQLPIMTPMQNDCTPKFIHHDICIDKPLITGPAVISPTVPIRSSPPILQGPNKPRLPSLIPQNPAISSTFFLPMFTAPNITTKPLF